MAKLYKEGEKVFVSGDISNRDYNVRVSSPGVVEADQSSARSNVLVTIDEIDGDHNVTIRVKPKLLSPIEEEKNNSDGGSKKYQLTVDGEVVSTHDTLDIAFKARNAKVRELCFNLVEDGIMDKYGAEDWCWNLEQNKNLEFYIDEGCGYQVNIVEVAMK